MDHSSNINLANISFVKGERSTFNRNRFINTTFESGKLIPFYIEEVLPHDTFNLETNVLIRSITPVAPTLDNAYLDIYYFWCPARILTAQPKQWEQIHGENIDSYWAPSEESTLYNTGNTIDLYADDITPTSIGNYFGLRQLTDDTEHEGVDHHEFHISKLPLKAYEMIWNEWFRDENLDAPVEFDSYADEVTYVNKLHDYFTSVLPSPQKAATVFLSLATSAPVLTADHAVVTGVHDGMFFTQNNGDAITYRSYVYNNSGSAVVNTDVNADYYFDGYERYNFKTFDTSVPEPLATGYTGAQDWPTGPQEVDWDHDKGIYPNNLYADLSQATGVSINEFRFLAALQQFYEKDALGGTRYREMIKVHFGVSVPETDVQVPEFLGSKSILLNMNQVVQTSSTDAVSPLGSTGAFSNTFDNNRYFVKSFVEFGYVVGVCCVRPQLSYSQGVPRLFTRNRRYDWYYPTFANVGEQPIYKNELYMPDNYWDGTTAWDVFGYNEAWASYRYTYNINTGYFGIKGDLNLTAWNYGSYFADYPTLSSGFMMQEEDEIGQTLTVKDASYQYIAQFYVKNKATRCMPLFSIPGLDRI